MVKAILDIRSFARTHTRSAIRTLSAISRQKDAPPSARVAAASELLNRGWGKPQQNHDVTDKKEILVTIRHLIEGSSDETQLIDVTPDDDEAK